jgi:Tfp pilus assembly protein PilF
VHTDRSGAHSGGAPRTERQRLADLEEAQSEFATALHAAEQGDPGTAAAAYQRALAIDPRFVEALVNLARVRAEQGDFEAAWSLLARARAVQPNYPEIYAALGWLAARQGDSARARGELERAIELDATDVEARINLAAVLIQHGSLPRALDLLESALALDPDNADATLNLALARDRLGDGAQAQYYYKLFLARSSPQDSARDAVSARLSELEAASAATPERRPPAGP